MMPKRKNKNTWTMVEARAYFERIVERAISAGPQDITKYGKPFLTVSPYRRNDDAIEPVAANDLTALNRPGRN
jgi:hypothetical protein